MKKQTIFDLVIATLRTIFYILVTSIILILVVKVSDNQREVQENQDILNSNTKKIDALLRAAKIDEKTLKILEDQEK